MKTLTISVIIAFILFQSNTFGSPQKSVENTLKCAANEDYFHYKKLAKKEPTLKNILFTLAHPVDKRRGIGEVFYALKIFKENYSDHSDYTNTITECAAINSAHPIVQIECALALLPQKIGNDILLSVAINKNNFISIRYSACKELIEIKDLRALSVIADAMLPENRELISTDEFLKDVLRVLRKLDGQNIDGRMINFQSILNEYHIDQDMLKYDDR